MKQQKYKRHDRNRKKNYGNKKTKQQKLNKTQWKFKKKNQTEVE